MQSSEYMTVLSLQTPNHSLNVDGSSGYRGTVQLHPDAYPSWWSEEVERATPRVIRNGPARWNLGSIPLEINL